MDLSANRVTMMLPAVALPGLVDGVGQDLKDGVLAALQPVGAENDSGALAHPVRALQRGNGLVIIFLFGVCFWHDCTYL